MEPATAAAAAEERRAADDVDVSLFINNYCFDN
jgi:hypothetical protein